MLWRTSSPFDYIPRTRVVFGAGELRRLGELARELGFRRTLLVADAGLVDAGYVAEARGLLGAAGVDVAAFHDFAANPDSAMVERGRAYAAPIERDSFIALGGGSSLDCAKGINFLLTNGGRIHDYWGYGKAARPMLPMIAVPTTAGTGSEAQSYALIADAETHVKMACGDPKAAFRVALLDPALTRSQPAAVTATSGYDALSHAVESYVTTRRTAISDLFAREAWRLLAVHFERVLETPDDLEARAAMQLGAFYAGVAIEQSMLGATHACANPLTARYGIPHGEAIALMLPHVVRWNAVAPASVPVEQAVAPASLPVDQAVAPASPPVDQPASVPVDQIRDRYAELAEVAHSARGDLAAHLADLAGAAGLGGTLRARGITRDALAQLAQDAAQQWTGRFNPRPFDAQSAQELYEGAW